MLLAWAEKQSPGSTRWMLSGRLRLRLFFFNTFCTLILNLTLFYFFSKLTLLAASIAIAWRNACAAPCMVARREDDEEDMIEDVYDVATRDDTQLQRAPLERYVVRYSNGIICYPFGIKYVY